MTTDPHATPHPQPAPTNPAVARRALPAFTAGAGIGVLGGMIGLGGAEFRLPLLIGVFGFAALHAVILNKAMSLIVVATALPARLAAVPLTDVAGHWPVIVTLHRVLAGLLVLIAAALLANHTGILHPLDLPAPVRTLTGITAGLAIGVVAALMGVAGGELLIPTIVVLFAVDIRLAGSLSLAVSLPTMLVAFARYSRDDSFTVLRANTRFLAVMAAGSITGTILGGLALGAIPTSVLVPALVALLLASAIKVAYDATPRSAKPTP